MVTECDAFVNRFSSVRRRLARRVRVAVMHVADVRVRVDERLVVVRM
jgi:hypothetical protein